MHPILQYDLLFRGPSQCLGPGPRRYRTRLTAHRTGRQSGCGAGGGGSGALEGKGPQRAPQRRLDRRLEEAAEAVGGGYCRLQMPLKLALAVMEGGCTSPPSHASVGGGYKLVAAAVGVVRMR